MAHRSMSWVAFAVLCVLAYGIWGVLSKVALDHTSWAQTLLMFGVGVVLVSLLGLALSDGAGWSARGAALAGVAGVTGAVGLGLFYVALGKGPASQVVPAIGIYPALTAVLALIFLSERLTAVQVGGVVLAVAGVLLVGIGS